MEEIIINKIDNKLVIKLSGKIESTFAEAHGEEIFSKITQQDDVTIDLEDVSYVSSAGLRIILKCAKLAKTIEVINVDVDVYEVFSISGFTEMIKIKRAKRVLSIEGKEVIGQGANGKVYRYDIDTIIKVYREGTNMDDIENEIAMSKKAFILGVPTAIPFDIVRIKEGGYGCVYELLKSDVMSNLIVKNPGKTGKFTELFASALSAFLHTETYDETLPKKTEYVNEWIEYFEENKIYSPDVISKIKKLISTIADGHTLVHGDFHIKNIMFQNDEPIIIDMDTLGVGHPLFEIAYSYYAMVAYDELTPEKTLDFFGIDYEITKKIYEDTFNIVFKDKSEEERKDIQEKASFLAHLRISYRANHHVPSDHHKAQHAVQYVLDNIDKFTTLDFKI